jgi:hypothetical protein
MLANMVRDSMAAYVTSGVKMTPVADTVRNFGKAMVERQGKDANSARRGEASAQAMLVA